MIDKQDDALVSPSVICGVLTKREWFAGMALAGMMSNCDRDGLNAWIWSDNYDRRKNRMATAAAVAFQMADAMIERGGK